RAAWDFFDTIPEYHQGCAITGALVSRARLVVMERDAEGNWQPTKNRYALEALDELFGGPEGQVEMLRQLGIHFSVAGEAWLMVPTVDENTDADDWQIAAATSLTRTGSQWKINGENFEGEAAIRLWKGHPADRTRADAPSRAILPVLSELHQLTKRIAAQIDSRLAGAALLMLPFDTELPASP